MLLLSSSDVIFSLDEEPAEPKMYIARHSVHLYMH